MLTITSLPHFSLKHFLIYIQKIKTINKSKKRNFFFSYRFQIPSSKTVRSTQGSRSAAHTAL